MRRSAQGDILKIANGTRKQLDAGETTVTSSNETAHKQATYKCEGCDGRYPTEDYVVNHDVGNKKLWFCLNCDEWIQDKTNVLNKDWTLFDTKVVKKLLHFTFLEIHQSMGALVIVL